jgi:uncharacterized protein (DUF983 family)
MKPQSAVNCPRCNRKTTGKPFRAANTTANVCQNCSRELLDKNNVKRVR